MSRGNGGPQGFAIPLDLADLLGGGPRERLTPEQKREQAIAAFNRTLDAALGGCDGAKEDADHRLRDESLVGFLRSSFRMDTVPPQVADAILKVLAFEVTHNAEDATDMGKKLAQVFDSGLTRALLIAGATLRVKDLPVQSTKDPSTGLYI